jgi:hypothetical protein
MTKQAQLQKLIDKFRDSVKELVGEGVNENDISIYISNVPAEVFTSKHKVITMSDSNGPFHFKNEEVKRYAYINSKHIR